MAAVPEHKALVVAAVHSGLDHVNDVVFDEDAVSDEPSGVGRGNAVADHRAHSTCMTGRG